MQKFTYDSLSELGSAVSKMLPAGSHDDSVSIPRSEFWDDNCGFDKACDIAITGGGQWTEGLKHMLKASADVEALKSTAEQQETDFSVTGHTLDVGEFLIGNPEHWEDSQDEEAPILRVGVQLYTPAGNSMSEFMNRGAALMSVLDDVVASGVQVEVWGCMSGKDRNKKGNGVDMRVLIKGTEHSWSPASVAFALCHPAVARRLGFRVAESSEELQRSSYLNSHSLDHKNDEPEDSNFDLWIGYSDMFEDYKTPSKALKRVTMLVKEAVDRKVNKGSDQ